MDTQMSSPQPSLIHTTRWLPLYAKMSDSSHRRPFPRVPSSRVWHRVEHRVPLTDILGLSPLQQNDTLTQQAASRLRSYITTLKNDASSQDK
jgi:hypothetical protein